MRSNQNVLNHSLYQPSVNVVCASNEQETIIHLTITAALPGQTVHLADYVEPMTADSIKMQVTVADSVHVTLIDDWCPTPEVTRCSWNIFYTIGAYACVTIQHHQQWPLTTSGSMRVQVTTKAQSITHYYGIIRGGSAVACQMQFNVQEHASHLNAGIIVIANDTQSIQLHTQQQHAATNTESTVLVRGLVKESAYSECTGIVHLASTAQSAHATQKSAFLLDGVGARAYARPVLEALNNEVSCTHGSAVGSLDPEQIVYCQTRGIHLQEARKMLIHSFLTEVCSEQTIRDAINNHLQKLFP